MTYNPKTNGQIEVLIGIISVMLQIGAAKELEFSFAMGWVLL